MLGGINGFTFRPATYNGYFNAINTPGFVYFEIKDDEEYAPANMTGSRWWWVFTFGRNDLVQIAWSNQTNEAGNGLYMRKGGTRGTNWNNQSWRKL